MLKEFKDGPLFARLNTPRYWAAGLFVLVLAFYLYTLQPSLTWGDGARIQREAVTGESFILAELVEVNYAPDPFPFARLGVAAWDHPLYVMVGYGLVHLLPFIDALWVVNAISAVCAAGIIAILFRVCYTHTRSAVASLLAGLMLAVAHTFWFHAVTPEVYSLLGLLLMASFALFDRYEQTGNTRLLYASSMMLGLAAANHVLAFLALPALGLYRLMGGRWRKWLAGFSIRTAALSAGAFFVGFLPYLVQLARMLRTFSIAELSGPVVGSTFLAALETYTPAVLLTSIITFVAYLFFQFPVGLGVGLYGLIKERDAHRDLWDKTLACFVVYALFGIVYKVSDQFAFFYVPYLFWTILMALGMARIGVPHRRWMTVGLAAMVIVMPIVYGEVPDLVYARGLSDDVLGIPEIGVGVRRGLDYYIDPNKRGDNDAYEFGVETLESLPPEAVIAAQWYTDTEEFLVLRYLTVVEGMRPDVVLLGWPQEPLIDFDSSVAYGEIEDRLLSEEPVFMASLSDGFYHASKLAERYCIVPEGNLYRLYPERPPELESEGVMCITEVQP